MIAKPTQDTAIVCHLIPFMKIIIVLSQEKILSNLATKIT